MINVQENLSTLKTFNVKIDKIKIVNERTLSVNKRPVKMTGQAFKDLVKLCGLTNKMIFHLNSVLSKSAGFNLVKEIMKSMEKQSGRKLSLIADEKDQEIKRIAPEGSVNSHINPDTVSELINYTIEKNPKIQLTNQFCNDGGTTVAFNLKYANPLTTAIPNEDISVGKQIVWDLLGPTQVYDLVEREVCTNGMTGIVQRNAYTLDINSTPSEWYQQMYEQMVNPSKELLNEYERGMFKARQNCLSVAEYDKLSGHLKLHWEDDQDKIVRYLGDESWRKEYDRRGIDLENITEGQKRNCPTPVNAWDAINCMTDLASHNYRSKVSDSVRRSTQKRAGKLLNGVWDEQQQMTSVPRFDVRGPQNEELAFTPN